ncbi:ABC transporter [Paenibacillus sp. CAA11]|uniref:ABC transporter ATP-binding protein n=1 Tax=Paenibacillus sp. CAA11 TaxID=1532905 RepID=UPI000D3B220F|nr:ABC transporter ATP-binding protein [Paenibacillus sp. CAA11]AWB43566.1 ABC transporter [Paenibacillus sp. CAA11]
MNNPVLEVRNICKKYGDREVVTNENFTVYSGDILGFIGPNGAGKSTSINMITTLVAPDRGNIFFREQDIMKQPDDFKRALGVVPQDLAIYEDLSAYENVRFFCALYGIKGAELKDRVKQALEFVGLWERRKDSPSKFSGGMKRRLNIACAIAHGPELLIMDEPTVGIDPQSRNKIMEAVNLLHQTGTTVIYTSHYMEEIETLCNRIVLMDKGVVLEDLDKKTYKEKYAAMGFTNLEEIFLHLTGTDLRDMEG